MMQKGLFDRHLFVLCSLDSLWQFTLVNGPVGREIGSARNDDKKRDLFGFGTGQKGFLITKV